MQSFLLGLFLSPYLVPALQVYVWPTLDMMRAPLRILALRATHRVIDTFCPDATRAKKPIHVPSAVEMDDNADECATDTMAPEDVDERANFDESETDWAVENTADLDAAFAAITRHMQNIEASKDAAQEDATDDAKPTESSQETQI